MEENNQDNERVEEKVFTTDQVDVSKIKSILLQSKTLINMLIREEQKKLEALLRTRK